MPMPRQQTPAECLQTMFALRRFGIKLGLATIRRMLAGLGDPHRRFKSIHIAGTNGKGSVASGLAAVLRRSGYRVGLYTSPHLVRFNERIQVDGEDIGDEDVVRLYRRVRRVLPAGREPTFFEFTTAMALDEFCRRNVQWAVIETGMGGRLDATNVITPELAVITNISLEHREYLGDTIAAIAFEKAGIIKRRKPVVTGVAQPSAFAVLEQTAGKKSAPLFRLGTHFRVRRHPEGTFTYHGTENVWRGLRTGLQGDYQVRNAAIVLAACELLRKKAPLITVDAIREGLLNNRWPGRLELVGRKPDVIFDGAHNLEGARQLGRFLSKNAAGRRLTLVVGILDDKPYAAMLRHLVPLAEHVVVTRARIDRALPPETLAAEVRKMNPKVAVIPQVAEALKHAVHTAGPEDLVLVAGSLYVVGEARAAIEEKIVRLG
jgi:dihydrofolate synthase/folylpolyglutamate synthase